MSDTARNEELMASAAAWVLNALPDDEAAAFEAELERNAALRDEVARLRPVADLLALAAPTADPPPGLQGRIMAIVQREADLLTAAGPEADQVVATQPAKGQSWLRRIFARPLIPVLTACVVAVVIGVGVGIGISGGGSNDVSHPMTFANVANASGDLVTHDGSGEMKLTGLQSPGAGRVYQVWVMKADGKVTPDNVFTVNSSGQGSVALRNDLDGAKQVLISVEPEGGSQQPTTSPIASATLS
jgi:anti-sigma-K factor RskA